MSQSGPHPEANRPPNAPTSPDAGARDSVRADLKAYLDGELSALRRLRVEWHLARCPECREEVAWLRRLGENMQTLEQAHPHPELRARILANLPSSPPGRVEEMKGSRMRMPRTARVGRPRLAVGGALAALALVGVFAAMRIWRPASPAGISSQTQARANLRPAPTDSQSPSQYAAATSGATGSVPSQGGLPSLPPNGIPPMPHTTYDPFRPADKQPTPATSAQAAPNPTHPRSSDGTYEAAVRLFEQRKTAELAAERRRLQERPVPASIRPPKNLNAPAAPVRLALTVADVSATRQVLQAFAQHSDGSPAATPTNGRVSGPNPTVIAPGPTQITRSFDRGSEPEAQNHPGNVLVLRVPAAQADSLLRNLERMGTLRPDTPSAPGRQTQPFASEHQLPAFHIQPKMRYQDSPSLLPGQPPSNISRRAKPTPSPAAPKDGSKFVTIVLRLQPAPRE